QQNLFFIQFFAAVSTDVSFYVVIQNLTFSNYQTSVVELKGDYDGTGTDWGKARYVTVRNCTMQNVAPSGAGPISTSKASHLIAKDNRILNVGNPTLGGSGSPKGEHFVYPAEGSEYIVLDNNYMEGNSGFGIHFWGLHWAGAGGIDPPSQYVLVRRNTVVNAAWAGLLTSGNDLNHVYIVHNTFYQEMNPYAYT